jgi:hypothetical protein
MPSNVHVEGTSFVTPLPQVVFGDTATLPPVHVGSHVQSVQVRVSAMPVSTSDFTV